MDLFNAISQDELFDLIVNEIDIVDEKFYLLLNEESQDCEEQNEINISNFEEKIFDINKIIQNFLEIKDYLTLNTDMDHDLSNSIKKLESALSKKRFSKKTILDFFLNK
jgi:hypothetical protein